MNTSLKLAGDDFDEAIVRFMRKKHNLLIGERTAEDIKIKIGTTYPLIDEESMEVRGRNLVTGLPKTVTVTSSETEEALREPTGQIVEAVISVLERTPPELSADILDRGIMLTGGGSMLRGLEELIEERTGINTMTAEEPMQVVAIGTGTVCRIFRRAERVLMDKIKGYVEHIVFRNDDNGYTVFHLNNDDGEVTCVGNFHFIEEGELLEMEGEYTTHKLYGLQFSVKTSQVCEPEDLVSIERYLGSGAIKGVGAALAGRIVKKFKEDTFRIIEEDRSVWRRSKGSANGRHGRSPYRRRKKRICARPCCTLQKYGISATLAAKIYQHYGRNIYRVIEENPYRLADDVAGVGFKTADEIARPK